MVKRYFVRTRDLRKGMRIDQEIENRHGHSLIVQGSYLDDYQIEALKKLNINCKEVAGLGNDYNDIDFLDICAEAYLVANAPVNLQRHYKLVRSDKEEGFTEFISKVL